jgi:hypothetical protein
MPRILTIEHYDVLQASKHARAAIRKGDLATAERWFRIADRAAQVLQRVAATARAQERSRWTVERNPS